MEEDDEDTKGAPSMVDILAEPNAPLAKAFEMCGWQTVVLFKTSIESGDLQRPDRQSKLSKQVEKATLVTVVFDYNSKSRTREIPEEFEDGRRALEPLVPQNYLGGPQLIEGRRRRNSMDSEVINFLLGLLEEHDRDGGGSIREGPLHDPHWWLVKEQEMMASERWRDKTYAACVLHGARCKQQRVRHNIDEIEDWPPMNCHHIHDPKEWHPHMKDGSRFYPIWEEAEHTAALAFYIAVSASWWAMRLGYAKMRVPKLPQVEVTGDRRPWLNVDPKALREWAMIPTALGLGISPPQADGIPIRRSVSELGLHTARRFLHTKPAELPQNYIYIGQGHHSHRLKKTKWASPFLPGVHGTAVECVGLYLDHLSKAGLMGCIQELRGKVLVSDCGPDEPCTGDALAAEFYASSAKMSGQKMVARNWMRRVERTPSRALHSAAAMGAATAAAWDLAFRFRISKPQESIVAAFRSLYPYEVFDGFKFPMIEDLVNTAPFTAYMEWRESKDLEWSLPLGPALVTQRDMRWARSSLGEQQGALSQKAAMPQLISFQQSPDDHFREAIRVGGSPTPTELMPAVDADLEFAAHVMCTRRGDLRNHRNGVLASIRELKHRWRTVTDNIRRNQHEAVRQVTHTRDVGLVALLMLLLHWPDISYSYHMLVGFPAVGYAPWCHVFSAKPASRVTRDYVLEGGQESNHRLRARLRPGDEDEFITQKSEEDYRRGWSSLLCHGES